MRVRPANYADIAAMMGIERQSASAAHWSGQQYEAIFEPNDLPLSQRFVLVTEDASEKRSETKADSHEVGRILAFLVAHRVNTEWELENIVVAGDSQHRGVGTRLLHALIDYARAADGTAVFLEVRQSNLSARALYRKLRFVETGSRKRYYTDPPDDAILYRLNLY